MVSEDMTMPVTNTKRIAHELIDKLPDDAGWDDVLYEIVARREIDLGLADSGANRIIPAGDIIREVGIQGWEATGTGGDGTGDDVIIIGIIGHDAGDYTRLDQDGDVQVARKNFFPGQAAALDSLCEFRCCQYCGEFVHQGGAGVNR